MESLEQRSQCARFSHLYWVVILNITCAVIPSAARFGVHFPCTLRYAPNLCSICTNTKNLITCCLCALHSNTIVWFMGALYLPFISCSQSCASWLLWIAA